MKLYFSQYFGIDSATVEAYGAVDISIASDLPLFIDPFLLFTSDKLEYKKLHHSIIKYLHFLKDLSLAGQITPGRQRDLFQFKEVKQNWLGFTVMGNEGHALGPKFATELNDNLSHIFSNIGNEQVTKTSHLEKVALISDKVGRDGISDFTTCLIKEYLAEYTQRFALEFLAENQRAMVRVPRIKFDYTTQTWQPGSYILPIVRDDFVLLTPADMLTRDDTWINSKGLYREFRHITSSLDDEALRDQINDYLSRQLSSNPSKDEFSKAVHDTIYKYPILLDYYIKYKEDTGDKAIRLSADKVAETEDIFIANVKKLYQDLNTQTDFYSSSFSSYTEALNRVWGFKKYVEDKDGYRLLNRNGQPFSNEKEVQLFFGLIWYGSLFDVNREPNNGRGPVDFKISIGSKDKSLIEFKLASNSKLKQNLAHQVPIYEAANDTRNSIKVIICYTLDQFEKCQKILSELNLLDERSIVVIDARSDNKPSASNAK